MNTKEDSIRFTTKKYGQWACVSCVDERGEDENSYICVQNVVNKSNANLPQLNGYNLPHLRGKLPDLGVLIKQFFGKNFTFISNFLDATFKLHSKVSS